MQIHVCIAILDLLTSTFSVYNFIFLFSGGRYTKCEIKGSTTRDSNKDVCKYDCGAHMADPTGNKALVRISHAPAGATISEIQYENPLILVAEDEISMLE